MNWLFVALTLTAPAQAGWFKGFCERHLVADDPWPFAKVSSSELIKMFRDEPDSDVTKELEYRMRAGMLTLSESGK